MAAVANLNNNANVTAPIGKIVEGDGPTNFYISADQKDVENYSREGNDLTIEFKDGRSLKIKGFFENEAGPNYLIFEHDGQRWLTVFDEALQTTGDGIVDPLVTYQQITDGTGALLGILGGIAGAGTLAGIALAGGSDDEPETDTIAPETPILKATIDDVAPAIGPFQAGATINDDTPTFSGTGEPGSVISVYDNGKLLGTTLVNDEGEWTFESDTALAEGPHSITITATDAAGNVSEPSVAFDFTIDTTAPSAVTIGKVAEDDGTVIANGSSTADTTPTLSGSGAEPGSTVNVYEDGELLGSAEVNDDGTWTFTPEEELTEGEHSLTVTNVDDAGNESEPSAPVIIDVDLTAPVAPVIGGAEDDTDPLTGDVVKDLGSVTNDKTPTLTGTGEAGSTITIKDGDTVLGTATVGPDGKWTFTTPDLADGMHNLTATATDGAGNESAPSTAIGFEVDTKAPTQSVNTIGVMDNVAPVEGAVAHNGYTNDAEPMVFGTLSDGLLAGEYVEVLRDGKVIGKATVTDKDWSFTDSGLVDGETYTYTARVVDAAGNQGGISADHTIHIDQFDPIQTVKIEWIADNQEPNTNNVASGGETNDSTPQLNGSLSSGLADNEVVAIYRDNKKVGEAKVSGTTWTYEDSGLTGNTTYSYTARVEDKAGNVGATSAAFTMTLVNGSITHIATITTVYDDQAPVVADVAQDGFTNDKSPLIKGGLDKALEGTQKLYIFRDGQKVGEATVGSDLKWTFQDSNVADGKHVYSAQVIDGAGNFSTVSNTYAINVDTFVPETKASIEGYYDNAGEVQGLIKATTSTTDDDTPELTGKLSAALGEGEAVYIFRDGEKVGEATVNGTTWTYKDAGLGSGSTYKYTAQVVDQAGNASTESNSLTLTLAKEPTGITATIVHAVDDYGTLQVNVLTGGYTDDVAPKLVGTLDRALTAGETVEIWRDGSKIGMADMNGADWTFEDSGLQDGKGYSYKAVIVSSAGNKISESSAFVLNVDRSAPTQTVTVETYTDDQVNATGIFGFAKPTNDTTPVINGTVSASLAVNEVVMVYRDGVKLGAATMNGASNWSFSDSGLADGKSYIYTARVEDKAGNVGSYSAQQKLTVDLTAPVAPVIGGAEDNTDPLTGDVVKDLGSVTNDKTPTLTGTGEAGSTITIKDGDTVLGTATVGPDGKWTFTTPDLADGMHNLTATATDGAGNESAPSAATSFEVDTKAPTQSVNTIGVMDNVAPVEGAVAHNGYTNDAEPMVFGTLSDGLLAGEYVEVLRDGKVIGKATVTGKDWSFTDSGLVDGETYTYTARVVDAAGNQGGISADHTIHIDQFDPIQTVKIEWIADNQEPNTNNVASGGETNDSTPQLNGSLSSGLADNEVVAIYRDNKKVGEAKVSGTTWTYEDSGLTGNTTYSYTARVEDKAGNVGATSAAFTMTLVNGSITHIATITTVYDDQAPVVADVAQDGFTNDKSPLIKGGLDKALEGTQKLYIFRDGQKVGEATVGSDLKWTFQDSNVADGKHVYSAQVIDGAGNFSAESNTYAINVDTFVPEAKASIDGYYDNAGEVQGLIKATPSTTDDDTPELTGKLSAALGEGEAVYIFRDGEKVGEATVNGTTWTYKDAGLGSGSTYKYTAQVVDQAGNASTESNSLTLTLAKEPTGITATIVHAVDDYGTLQVNVLTGGYTDDVAPKLVGTLDRALTAGETVEIWRDGSKIGMADMNGADWTFEDSGLQDGKGYSYKAVIVSSAGNKISESSAFVLNVDRSAPTQTVTVETYTDDQVNATGIFGFAKPTNDTTPVINGTVSASLAVNEVVMVYRDGVKLGAATMNGASNWSFSDSGLADGKSYIYTARVEDKAGNVGSYSAQQKLTVDLTAPVAPVIGGAEDNTDPLTGDVVKDLGSVTNDKTPTLTGTGEANTTITIKDGDTVLGTATVGPDGKWTFTTPDLADGMHNLTATATDGAGNESAPSAATSFEVDTKAPTQSVNTIGVMDNVAPVEGAVAHNGYTNDAEPMVFGTLSDGLLAGEYVEVLRDGKVIGKATVTGKDWSFTDSGLKDSETYTYTARVVDAAGNQGGISADHTIHIDQFDPTQTVKIEWIADNQEPNTNNVASGGETNDSTPQLNGSLSSGLADNEVVAIYRDNKKVGEAKVSGTTWTYEDSGLTGNTTYSYTARVEDKAGNVGATSAAFTMTLVNGSITHIATITTVYDDQAPVVADVAQDGFTNDKSPLIKGGLDKALEGTQKLYIFRDGQKVGEATVGSDLKWTFQDSNVADGKHVYSAQVIDGAGNFSAESNTYAINVDTFVPEAKASIDGYYDNAGEVQGLIKATTSTTDDDTPELTGKLSAALGEGEAVYIFRDGEKVGEATVNGTTWTYKDAGLGSGSTYKYTAQVVDQAGNASTESNSLTLTLAKEPTGITATIVHAVDDYGTLQVNVLTGGYTDDVAPKLVGTLDRALTAGETVEIWRDGSKIGMADMNGADWTFEDSGLQDGKGYSYKAVIVSSAGNKISESSAFVLNVDRSAPTQTVTVETYTDDQVNATGIFGFAKPTNDTTPVINGTVSASLAVNEVVMVYRDGVKLGAATMNGASNWSFSDSGLADGKSYIYTARVEDKAGNVGSYSAQQKLTVDLTAPVAPVIGGAEDNTDPLTGDVVKDLGSVTNDKTPTLTGTGEAGSTITIKDGDTVLGTATVGPDGKWTFTTPDLADGMHNLTATATDGAGNESAPSAATSFEVDTKAPTQSVNTIGVMDNVAPVEGAVAHNGYTNDAEPMVFGTLSDGLLAGEYVEVLRDGKVIGKATVTGKDWSFTDSGLVDGETYTYTARVVDAAGNQGGISADHTIHIDQFDPIQTVKIEWIADNQEPNTNNVASGGETNDSTPQLNGSLSSGLADNEVVAIYRDNKKVGEAKVSGTTWTYEDSGLTGNTTYSYTARVEDKAGNVGATSAAFTMTLVNGSITHIATITTVYDDQAPVVADVAQDGFTNDKSPLIKGGLDKALEGTQKLYIFRDGQKVGEATVGSDLKWTFQDSNVADGKHVYSAQVIDGAGNFSAESNTYAINVDTFVPEAKASIDGYYDNAGEVQGLIKATPSTTDDDTPELTGKLSAALGEGEAVYIFRDGEKVGEATINGSTWTYKDAGLGSGSTYKYTAQVVDQAGNASTESNSLTLTLAKEPTGITATIVHAVDDYGTLQVNVLTGGYTDDVAPKLVGTLDRALTAGETVEIWRDGSKIGMADMNGADWTFEDSGLQDGKGYSYKAVIVSSAGNKISESSAFVLNVDRSAPTQTVTVETYTDDQVNATGIFGFAKPTNDTTPVINGTVSASLAVNEVVMVYRDGVKLGAATMNGASNWSFSDSGLADGKSYIYTARVEDKAGNVGSYSAQQKLTVDLTAPVAPVIGGAEDNTDPLTGDVVKDLGSVTNDKTPTLTGTGEANTTITIKDGDTVLGTATVGPDGKWTFTTPDLADGMHNLTATATDGAGNESAPSAATSFEVDTKAPTATSQITAITEDSGDITNDFETNDQSLIISGKVTGVVAADEKVQIKIDDGQWQDVSYNSANGTWTYDNSSVSLAEGTHVLETRVVDAAGNQKLGASQELTIDKTGPTVGNTISIDSFADDTAPLTGDFASGTTTNDTTPLLKGKVSGLEDGDTIRIYQTHNGVTTLAGKAIVAIDGKSWTFIVPQLDANGLYTYEARITDKAGNEGTKATGFNLTLDTALVVETASISSITTDTGELANDFVTSDNTLVFHAKADAVLQAGQKVQIFGPDGQWHDTTYNSTTGLYSYDHTKSVLSDGTYEIKARVVASSGTEGKPSDAVNVVVDTTPPQTEVSITAIKDDADPVIGDIAHNGFTNDTTPQLVGSLTVALKDGEYVEVLRNGSPIGKAKIGGDGLSWTYDDAGLAADVLYTYTARVVDAAGNIGDISDPHSLTVVDSIPTGTITVNPLSTADTTPTISGSLSGMKGGEQVWITVNGKIYKQGVDSNLTVTGSTWSLKILDADAINLNGSSDKVLNINAEIVAANGIISDNTNNEVTVLRGVTVTLPLGAEYLADIRPSLIGQGKVAAGETIIVEVKNSAGTVVQSFSSASGEVVVNSDGGWTISSAAWKTSSLVAGTYSVQAKVTVADGSGGHISEVESFTIVQPSINKFVTTNGDDVVPQVYALSDGTYWLFWAHSDSTALSGNYFTYAQHYKQDGTPILATPISIDNERYNGYSNKNNDHNLAQYDVHFRADGSFSVFYVAGYGRDPFVRSYDAKGNPVGDRVEVTDKYEYEVAPTYVEMPDGSYVVIYTAGSEHNYNIYQQRYNANGTPIDKAPVALTADKDWMNGFAYNVTYHTGHPVGKNQIVSTSGINATDIGNGQYAMLYMSKKTSEKVSTTDTDMYIRVYDFATGKMVGQEVSANTMTAGYQVGAQVIALKEGGFVTVWVSNHTGISSSLPDGSMDDFNVYARRFEFNGTNIVALDPAEVRVNTSVTGVNGVAYDGLLVNIGAAALAHGGYVVVWSKFTSVGTAEVYGQTFDAAGNKLGGETLISTGSDNLNHTPSVAALPDGGYVVTWSHTTTNTDYWDNYKGDIHAVTVNADGTIRGTGDGKIYPVNASYNDGTGTLAGGEEVNTLDGRNGAGVMNSGGGNDYIIIKDTTFTSVDGGNGTDTLIWDSSAHLNFSTIANKVKNIEILHLGDKYNNTLSLTVNDVLSASNATDTLVVQGGTGDKVNLEYGWHTIGQQIWRGETYQVYLSNDSKEASLWVQQGVTVEVKAPVAARSMLLTAEPFDVDPTSLVVEEDDLLKAGSTVEQVIAGTSGDDALEAGNTVAHYDLTTGGHDTLIYKLLSDAQGSGESSNDTVEGFTLGQVDLNSDADQIDLSALLSGHTSINDIPTANGGSGQADVTVEELRDLLTTRVEGTDTVLSLQVNDPSGAETVRDILTLKDVQTDLNTLIENHQIII